MVSPLINQSIFHSSSSGSVPLVRNQGFRNIVAC